jgi:hypothetical protein
MSARVLFIVACLCSGLGCTSGAGTAAKSGSAGAPSTITLRAYDRTPIACGANTCIQMGEPSFSIPRVCCVDAAQSLCGTRSSSNDCVAALDNSAAASCPKPTIFGMQLEACCTDTGQCGADSTAVGLGCVDLADMNFRNLAENPPDPRPCHQ